MVSHILFPTDASDNSRKALTYVKDLAKTFGAKVTILHAYMYSNAAALMTAYEIPYDSLSELHEKAKAHIEKYLDEVRDELTDAGLQVETEMLDGDAGQLTVKVADGRECDLIIMGTRGLGVVQSFLLGSISNYVIHHTDRAVMLIPNV